MLNGVALLAISQHPRFGAGARGLGRYAGLLIGSGAAVFSSSIFLLLLDRPRSASLHLTAWATSDGQLCRFRFLGPVTRKHRLFELHCIDSKVLIERRGLTM